MQEEKKRILQLVQEGKLSADDALALLTELDKAEQESGKKEESLVHELAPVNKFEESDEKSHDSFQKKIHSSKDKVIDFIDSAIKKMKEADLDFNFGASVDIAHIFHQNQTFFKEINIEIANGKANLIPWDQQDLRVECQAKIYRVNNQDEARSIFLRDVLFSANEYSFQFAARQKSMKIEANIYVPKSHYDQVNIRLFNGSISGENLQFEKMKAKTANGAITFNQLSGEKAEFETGNGAITVEHAHLEKIEAETLNGSIVTDGYFNKIDAQSFSGDISCYFPGRKGDYIHAKTVTGKIYVNLESGTAVHGELKSNIGSLHVNLPGIEVVEEKNEVVQKVLTFKTARLDEPALHIFADTKTGSITIN
ncbi:DUF4097 domain-containing protein [Bacillus sp. V59.32b]|uniref:DUF4097 family beta strand repeat-containing protein n=1 Tax=Bacillus sp. V59.32b TaxID=1758642 RepID=UPI000E3D4463|nr:DUF4097 domain-containing protein [Bacillus sp. V59.32b]RFU67049.1 DUF4097 domain-containing protein [Bacillus sp. V59.32b]